MSNTIDSKEISKLADILDKKNLTELEFETENFRICLTRDFSGGVASSVSYAHQVPVMQAPVQISSQVATPSVAQEVASSDDYSKHAGAVKSPMVGVAYLSSAPTTPDYVSVGSSVKEGDTVCLIEAMKTFNPVKASKSGRIVKILIASGDPVEYGQALVVIE